MKALLALSLLIGMIVFAPIVIIWAVNILFGLGIDYNLYTWAAAGVLYAAFGRTTVSVNK